MTTRLIDPDSSSEGICTVKFCNLLAERGHEVTCLNGDDTVASGPVPWMPRCRVVPLPGAPGDGAPGRSRPRWAELVSQKIDAGFAYGTGFNRVERAGRRRWRAGLQGAIAEHRSELVFVRGAGGDFLPHLAMTDLGGGPPWIAHYHDPWPLSLYPAPYGHPRSSISLLQERANRRILARADAVTFPSQRLLDWEARQGRVDLRDRAVVVPHLGPDEAMRCRLASTPEPAAASRRPLELLHAGFLNRQRDPQPLLDALERRLDRAEADGAAGEPTMRLLLVGPVDAKVLASSRWRTSVARLVDAGWLVVDPRRVSYASSLAALRSADVAVLLAVGEPESPFFPAKLADLVALDRPMLVVAPRASTPADVMGIDHPGFVALDRPADLDATLAALVDALDQGTLDRFRPPASARALISSDHVGDAIEAALGRAVEIHDRRRRGR